MLRRGAPASSASGTFDNAASIEVSQGHLSAERIRKLSSDMAPDDSFWKNLLLAVVVLVLGFGVGLFISTRMAGSDDSQPLGINEELFNRR